MGDGNLIQNRLGKYQLVASLGQGGMAKVYLALVAGPAGVNKLMVLKVLGAEMLNGPEGGLELFWDEARLATRLVHPNIVHTYEVGEIDGHYFLAMEYLDGQTYRVVQARGGADPLPLAEDLRIISEVARGLHYAHELKDYHGAPLGVVHRDVSPQNVFVTYDGQVKLIDFGIAKTSDAGHETRVGLIKGKLNYIAPEQLAGDPLDRRADIFALGVMLWECVAGKRFAGGGKIPEVAKVHARIKGEEPNIRSVKPEVAEELAVIIDRALAVDREQRWSDVASFADALDAYVETSGKRPGSKLLSSWMQRLFAEDRAAMRKVIDERVQLLQRSPTAVEAQRVPNLRAAEEPNTGSGVYEGMGERSGSVKNVPGAPSLEAHSRAPVGLQQKLRLAAIGAGGTMLIAAVAALLSPADATKGATDAPAIAAAKSSADAPSPSPLAPAAASGAAKPDQAPLHITLSLSVSPPEAQVSIDGAAVAMPFSGAFNKSSTLHRIEATAEGHRPYVRLVPFDQDLTLALLLERTSDASKRNSAGRARSASDKRVAALPESPTGKEEKAPVSEEPTRPAVTAPGSDIGPARSKLGHGQIDTADPYSGGN